MQVIEVFGPPGVGKSTLCNDRWPPSIPWDGQPTPAAWAAHVATASRLAMGCQGEAHWLRMYDKALRKISTLRRQGGAGVYAGVGLVMRGLDLAWRIAGRGDVADYFWTMPRPDGAISLSADPDTVRARNVERGKARPSRELSRLMPLFEAPQRLAVSILRERGVIVLELDTRDPVDANRSRIADFAGDVGAAAAAGGG